MKAINVMTRRVVTVEPDTQVREVVALMLKYKVSAIPVVTVDQKVIGIISEGDLMSRVENKSHPRHSWWLEAFYFMQNTPEEYVKAHGRKARDVMTTDVVSVSEDTLLYEIAQLLEKKRIKRVPVIRDGKLVGIVSRANLLHGLASQGSAAESSVSPDDATIRNKVLDEISGQLGLNTGLINVIVNDGVVQLWGVVSSETERKAAQVAAENVSGVKAVENNLGSVPPWAGAY